MGTNPSRVIQAAIDRSDEFLANEGGGPSLQEAVRRLALRGGSAIPAEDDGAAGPRQLPGLAPGRLIPTRQSQEDEQCKPYFAPPRS